MDWNNRKYHFYLIFGVNNPEKEPWMENEWFNNFEPLFSKIIEASSSKNDTGIRVLEMIKENENEKYYKECKLGRLKWDKKSHEKWTLKNNDKRTFLHFASWTPIWTICEKNNTPPDIYISIWNEYSKLPKEYQLEYQFNTFVTITIAENIGNLPTELLEELSKKFNSKKTVYNKRTWGKGKHDEKNQWKFINSIQDTNSHGIYTNEKIKGLNIHTIKFEEIEFEPYWEIKY